MLEKAGGIRGKRSSNALGSIAPDTAAPQSDSDKTDELIWAASLGDLRYIHRLVARGVSLDSGDYDRRTPLHLAASEGHLPVVQYLIDQQVDLNPRDRWGGTPLADALRHGHTAVADLLQSQGAIECPAQDEQDHEVATRQAHA